MVAKARAAIMLAVLLSGTAAASCTDATCGTVQTNLETLLGDLSGHLNQAQLDAFNVTTSPRTDFAVAAFEEAYTNVTGLFEAHVGALEDLAAVSETALRTPPGAGASQYYVNSSSATTITTDRRESVVFVPVNRRADMGIEACNGDNAGGRNREVGVVARQTAGLDSSFQSIADRLRLSHGITQPSMRLAMNSGTLRMFTGMGLPSNEKDYDEWLQSWIWANFEPWYTSAATGAKDVVVLLDVSGSMLGSAIELGRVLADTLVASLSARDRVGMIMLNWKVAMAGCEADSLVFATESNKKAIRRSIPGFQATERANFMLGADYAFAQLAAARRSSEGGVDNRTQVLFWISDGGDKDDNFNYIRTKNEDGAIRVFTFLTGAVKAAAGDNPMAGLKDMACSNNGQFHTVSGLEQLHKSVRNAFDELSRNRNQSLTKRELMAATAASSMHSVSVPQAQAPLPSEWTIERKLVSLAAPIYVNSSAKVEFGYNSAGADIAAVAVVDVPLDTLASQMEAIRRNATPTGAYPMVVDTSGTVMYHPLYNASVTDGNTVPMRLANISSIEPALSVANVTAILTAVSTEIASLSTVGPVRLLPSERALSARRVSQPANNTIRYYYRRLSGFPYVLAMVVPSSVYPVSGQIDAAAPRSSVMDAASATGADSFVRLQRKALCSGTAAVSAADVSSTSATNCDGTTLVTLAAREAAYLTQPWAPTLDANFSTSAAGPLPADVYTALGLFTPAGVVRLAPAGESAVATPSLTLEESVAADKVMRASYRSAGPLFGAIVDASVPYADLTTDFGNWNTTWLGVALTRDVTINSVSETRVWATAAAKMSPGWLKVAIDTWLGSDFGTDGGVVLLVNSAGDTVASSTASTNVAPDFLFTAMADVVDLMVVGRAAHLGHVRTPVAVCITPVPPLESSAADVLHAGTVGAWRWISTGVAYSLLWATATLSVLLSDDTTGVAADDTDGEEQPYVLPVESCVADTPSFTVDSVAAVTINSATTSSSTLYSCSGARMVQVVPLSGTSLFAIVATGRGADCDGLPAYSFAPPFAVTVDPEAHLPCGLQLNVTDTSPTPSLRVSGVACAASSVTPSAQLTLALLAAWAALVCVAP